MYMIRGGMRRSLPDNRFVAHLWPGTSRHSARRPEVAEDRPLRVYCALMAQGIWYYGKSGDQLGPVTADTLRRMLADGQLSPTDPVWQDGMAEWVAAGSVPALAPAAPPPLPGTGAAAPPPATAWPQQPAHGGPQQAWPPVGYYPAGYSPAAAPDPARKKAVGAAKASWCAVLVAMALNVA